MFRPLIKNNEQVSVSVSVTSKIDVIVLDSHFYSQFYLNNKYAVTSHRHLNYIQSNNLTHTHTYIHEKKSLTRQKLLSTISKTVLVWFSDLNPCNCGTPPSPITC